MKNILKKILNNKKTKVSKKTKSVKKVIKPDECIDCGVCEPECPVDAIISDNDDNQGKWLDINKKYADIWPNITEKKDPPEDHEQFKDVKDKYEKYFKENLE